MTKYLIYYSTKVGGYEKHFLKGTNSRREFCKEICDICNNDHVSNLISGFTKDVLSDHNSYIIQMAFCDNKPDIIDDCLSKDDDFLYVLSKNRFTDKAELTESADVYNRP